MDISSRRPDAIVVGAGPNGLAAAITLARRRWKVLLIEAAPHVGGAVSSAELTLPGFVHDRGSAIHPFGVGSPILRSLPLERHGLRWVYSPTPLAHLIDEREAVLLRRSVSATARGLGDDGRSYERLMRPLARHWEALSGAVLGPLIPPPLRPLSRLLALAAFGPLALCSARLLTQALFRGERARALIAGLAGHSVLPLEALASASFGLVLGMLGHAVGWPFPAGGAQQLSDAMAAHLRELGGEIITGCAIEDLDHLPPARAVLLNLTPRQVLRVVGDRLPPSYRGRLERYRYGPGAFKIDWALAAPIPWRAAECAQAATIHIGGTFDQIAEAERVVAEGGHAERPYILVAQHSLFDPTRAPAGQHTAWAYCHVPNGSAFDMTARIEAQIERAAPGFQSRILARHVSGPSELERWDANLVGGDVGGGAQDLAQLLARPTLSLRPYRTPMRGVYLCSAATPPGGGVHGMAGFHAAQAVLADSQTSR